MLSFTDYDPFDVMPICSNCKFEGDGWKCLSLERKQDIQNGCEKDCTKYCVYFKQQDWITKEQEEYKRRQKNDTHKGNL